MWFIIFPLWWLIFILPIPLIIQLVGALINILGDIRSWWIEQTKTIKILCITMSVFIGFIVVSSIFVLIFLSNIKYEKEPIQNSTIEYEWMNKGDVNNQYKQERFVNGEPMSYHSGYYWMNESDCNIKSAWSEPFWRITTTEQRLSVIQCANDCDNFSKLSLVEKLILYKNNDLISVNQFNTMKDYYLNHLPANPPLSNNTMILYNYHESLNQIDIGN